MTHDSNGQRPARALQLAGLLLLWTAHSVCAVLAAEESADIAFNGNTYAYTYSTILEGAHSAILRVASDYEHLDRLNDSITESRVLERYDENSLKRLLALRKCVLFLCFRLRFVEHVRIESDAIHTTIIPAESTFHDGTGEWRFEAVDDHRTRITMRASQTPDFWIPPVLGPALLKRVFLAEVRETCANLERLAREAGTTTATKSSAANRPRQFTPSPSQNALHPAPAPLALSPSKGAPGHHNRHNNP
ncbi:MAG: hypothetical protein WD928_16125 [Gammaproteobacteria bacterium]